MKNGLVFHTGSFNWRDPYITQDRISGTYRDRRIEFSYSALMFTTGYATWDSQLRISTFHRPTGTFMLDKRWLFSKEKSRIGDRFFDKKVRIVRENPKGYVYKVISDKQLRNRVYRFFSFPFTVDRAISLSASGRLNLLDRGIIRTENKLLEALDLLCDLAEAIDAMTLEV